MSRTRILAAAAAIALACATPASASSDSGYPSRGKAIDQLTPASDYTDVMQGRPRALGIMRARANGFVPSPQMHVYVQGVLARVLHGVPLPATFQPDVRILAAPEFSALCTPDGTIIITIGLLEQLDNEDELAFVLAHEVSHAIYRHHDSEWFTKAQYFAVMNGAAVQSIADTVNTGGFNGTNVGRGLDVAQHMYKLSQNVLAPQMTRGQEDAADALGFDLMVRAGYDSEAALAVMDKLAEQEAEAAAAAASAKDAAKGDDDHSGGLSTSNILGGLGNAMSGNWTDLAITAFDTAVDNMSDEATSHHPATQRAQLLSAYEFREYRDLLPASPTPLPWAQGSKSPNGPALVSLLAHYAAAENAAAYIADQSQGTPVSAKSEVTRSTTPPTVDHAYTEFVAAEYYDMGGQKPLSEAALKRAIAGSEPSWEIYSRLLDIYIARNDWTSAEALMNQAVTRFDNSPVLLPKHIQILVGAGDQAGAQALLPQCKSYDIRELTDACKKAAEGG
jgi:predicted Zn-dependent protease